jgi:hypothetical protein
MLRNEGQFRKSLRHRSLRRYVKGMMFSDSLYTTHLYKSERKGKSLAEITALREKRYKENKAKAE